MDAPPSPLPPLPRPLSSNSVSHCALLDLSITAEPCPHGTRPRPHGRGPVHASQPLDQHQLAAGLEGAELNTTLALRAELQSLQQGAQWDPSKTLKETLEKNKRTQALINSRATHGVSFPRHAHLYSSLVSVHVTEGHVIRRAALQRLPLAAASKAPPLASSGPSLLPLTADLCHRSLPHQPSPAPCVRPRPHSATFSLFQRHQRWASTF